MRAKYQFLIDHETHDHRQPVCRSRMKNKYLLALILFFFLAVFAKYVGNLYFFSEICHGYIIGDWLINYSCGFVRRGLSGYLILKTSHLAGIKANHVVTLIQTVLYAGFLAILFKLLSQKKINLWFVLLLASPATLLFPILDLGASGRKEIILFFIFSLYVLGLQQNRWQTRLGTGFFSAALLIGTLCHELIIFYIPYFIAANYLQAKTHGQPPDYKRVSLVIAGAIIAAVPLMLWGKHIHGETMGAGLVALGLSPEICTGILAWPDNFGIKDALAYYSACGYLKLYGITLALSMIPFFLFGIKTCNSIVTRKSFLAGLVVLFLLSAPLFLLAVDWGRWINIHCIMLMILCLFLLPDLTNLKKPGWANQAIAIPGLGPNGGLWGRIAFVFFGLIYVTCWRMPLANQHGAIFQTSLLYRFLNEIIWPRLVHSSF
jgi:hypothetical protein